MTLKLLKYKKKNYFILLKHSHLPVFTPIKTNSGITMQKKTKLT